MSTFLCSTKNFGLQLGVSTVGCSAVLRVDRKYRYPKIAKIRKLWKSENSKIVKIIRVDPQPFLPGRKRSSRDAHRTNPRSRQIRSILSWFFDHIFQLFVSKIHKWFRILKSGSNKSRVKKWLFFVLEVLHKFYNIISTFLQQLFAFLHQFFSKNIYVKKWVQKKFGVKTYPSVDNFNTNISNTKFFYHIFCH